MPKMKHRSAIIAALVSMTLPKPASRDATVALDVRASLAEPLLILVSTPLLSDALFDPEPPRDQPRGHQGETLLRYRLFLDTPRRGFSVLFKRTCDTLLTLASGLLPAARTLPWLNLEVDFRSVALEQWRADMADLPTNRGRLCFALHRIPDALTMRVGFRHAWTPVGERGEALRSLPEREAGPPAATRELGASTSSASAWPSPASETPRCKDDASKAAEVISAGIDRPDQPRPADGSGSRACRIPAADEAQRTGVSPGRPPERGGAAVC